jgi:hypothetical protein
MLLAACGGGSDAATNTPDGAASPSAAQSAATDTPSTATGAAATATKPAPAAATATAPENADETPTDDTAANATATSSDTAQLTGKASVDDVSADIVNLLNNPPDDPMPGIDLRKVQIEGDGQQIVATITTEGDIAAELSDDVDVSFDVHLWQDDRPAYAMSFHHNGSGDWEAIVTDFGASLMGTETTIDTPVTVDGNTLSAAFPADQFPDLDPTFQWYSSVMLSPSGMILGLGSWFDGAPDNVFALLANPDKFVEFPQ